LTRYKLLEIERSRYRAAEVRSDAGQEGYTRS
jgi:hypothetical protein